MNSGPCSGSRAWAPITSSSSAPGRRDAAVLALCQEEPAFRERLLVESRKRCCEIFQRRASPGTAHASPGRSGRARGRRQPARVSRRAGHGAQHGGGPGQDMLKRAVGLLDADAMIDAGAAVLTRAEKKLVKAQLGLFAALRTDAGQRNRLSRIVGEALEGMPLNLAPLARKLVDSSDETQRAATDGEMGAREEGAAGSHDTAARREPLPDLPDYTLAIVDDEELHALIRAQFEGAGDGAELPRLFAYLASRPQLQLPEALRHRAAEIIESVWDERNASPRRLLAAALLGRDDVSFRAMPAMSWPARASRIPWAWHCRKTRSPAKATTWRPATGRSAIPGPPARATNICRRMRRWLCWPASFTNCGPAGCGASLSFRRWRFPSSASCGNGWWPSRAQGLFARLAGVGRRAQAVLDGGGRRFHIACPGCRRRARRIHLPRPGGAGTGGYDQVVQWTAWLLRSTPTRWPRTSIRCCARR